MVTNWLHFPKKVTKVLQKIVKVTKKLQNNDNLVTKWQQIVKNLTIFQRFSALKWLKCTKKWQISGKNLCNLTMDFYLTKFLKYDIMESSGLACVSGPGTPSPFMGNARATLYSI